MTGIEWTDETWNPVTGCTKVSEGCRNCYAERITVRFKGDFSKIVLHPERLKIPLKWKKPRKIFVNSMSDLFHEEVPDEFIDSAFSVMALSPNHIYQVLTKRPNRMMEYLRKPFCVAYRNTYLQIIPQTWKAPKLSIYQDWPLPNVWLGVSVEDQKTVDERIPILLQTQAVVRFVSIEPLLEPVTFEGRTISIPWAGGKQMGGRDYSELLPLLDWIIVGGESGPKARPMHPDWVRSIRDQCKSAWVPFFFKQWGEFGPITNDCNRGMRRLGKKKAGRLLDGKTWEEFPNARRCN